MVGVVMRQPGALPDSLIALAIHHRRSGANDRPTYYSYTPASKERGDRYVIALRYRTFRNRKNHLH
ncbi:hypothetical protein [Sporosarcina ureae]|uniref:hypothetical protein n=1 Tax=Sporosarcina ureae TaxID=1571 RepID=UPI0012F507E7|nr:hypothetical protein [Sporosarcina ureae]